GMVKLAERAGGNGIYSAADTDRSAPARDEIAQLRAAIERLERRVGGLEPPAAAPRRPLRQVLTDLVIGSRRYARRPGPHLPNVTVVTPVAGAADAGAVRATVESVLAQNYHALEFILVLAASDSNSTRLAPDTLAAFEDRIGRVLVEPTGNVADAAAKGLAAAEGELLHVLHAGHVLEAGAVQRVAEYFARRRGVQAAYSEDALLLAGGWKFPAPPQPTADVDFLLRCRNAWRNGVFFRRRAYHALGPLKPELGAAAEWDLWVRLARRFELRRIGGHFRSVPLNGSNVESGRSELDWNRAH